MKLTKEALKKMIIQEIKRSLNENEDDEHEYDDEDVAGTIEHGPAFKALDKLGYAVITAEDVFGKTETDFGFSETDELKKAVQKFVEDMDKKHKLGYPIDWFGQG